MTNVSEHERMQLAETLGRPVEAFAPVTDLTAIPFDTLEAARRLPEPLVLPFLQLLTPPDEHRWLGWFAEDVVARGLPPLRFGRGGVLVASASLADLLTTPVAELLARLKIPGGSWVGVAADAGAWARGNELAGAPAWRHDALDYRFRPDVGIQRVHGTLTEELDEPVERRARRWLASRLAWVRRHAPTLELPLGDDARIALRALEREPARSDRMPGFRGPGEWYAG